jgi:HEAT repeat protein
MTKTWAYACWRWTGSSSWARPACLTCRLCRKTLCLASGSRPVITCGTSKDDFPPPSAAPVPPPSAPARPAPTASWREALERLPIVEGADSRLLIERILQEGGEEAAQALIHFLEDPRWNRREIIIQALRGYPHFPSSCLHPLLTHPLWYVRAAAIELLGSFQDPILLEHATRLAKDPNIEVRRALVGAMRHFPFAEDARLVLEVLARDDHFLIRRLARESLTQLRQTSSSMDPGRGAS